MENKIKEDKFFLIQSVAISKTNFLVTKDNNMRDIESAAGMLSNIIAGEPEEFLASVSTLKQAFKDGMKWVMKHPMTISKIGDIYTPDNQNTLFQRYWIFVCIVAYFFYHDDALWKKCLFKNLEKDITIKILKADLAAAKAAIDEYYSEQSELEDAILFEKFKNSQVPTSPQHPTQLIFNAPVGQVNANVEHQTNTSKE